MALDSAKTVEHVDVNAHVPRLNHNEFTYNINIQNDNAEAHAVIRIYLCPKYDNNGVEFTFEEQRWHCIEMDKFWKHLEAGENKVSRKSSDSSITTADIPSMEGLIEDAKNAIEKDQDLEHKTIRSCGLPNRMLLPKGKAQGMKFSLVVAVSDGHLDENHEELEKDMYLSHGHCGVHGQKYPDHQPMGYPLDRKVKNSRLFTEADNIHISTVKVFHKNKPSNLA